MDKLYRENAEFKVKVRQLEENNEQLEQGLKEVLEQMKKYSPGEDLLFHTNKIQLINYILYYEILWFIVMYKRHPWDHCIRLLE